MTSFVNDNGEYLDFSGEIGHTKQIANFFDFKIKGDVSATFKLDNNSVNRKALGLSGPQQISPMLKVPFTMLKDGNVISKGFIVVETWEDEISCFFLSGNSNWFQLLDFNLREVEFPPEYTISIDDIDARKAATDGIVFPLIDFWGQGQKRSEGQVSPARAPGDIFQAFKDWHPCIYLHTLVTYMAAKAGVKVVIDDPIYKRLVITPDGPEYFVPDFLIDKYNVKVANQFATLYTQANDPNLVQWTRLISNGTAGNVLFDSSTSSFTIPVTGVWEAASNIFYNPADSYTIETRRNGVAEAVNLNSAPLVPATQNVARTVRYFFNKGDVITTYVTRTGTASNYRLATTTNVSTLEWRLYKPINQYVIPSGICPDMKGVDLVKFLAMYFACSVSFDDYSKTITLNKLSSFRKEDAEDWSEFLVSHETKWDTGVAKNNIVQTQEVSDEEISAHNDSSIVSLGGGKIVTNTERTENKNLYTIPFAPSWDVRNNTKSKIFAPFIKFYDIEFGQQVAYTAVASSGGGGSTFTATFNDPIVPGDVFFVDSNSGDYDGFHVARTSATATTNPVLATAFISTDAGTITKCNLSRTQSEPRLLVVSPGKAVTSIGSPTTTTIPYYSATILFSTLSTYMAAWSDKPILDSPLDGENLSTFIDSVNPNNTIGEIYYGPLKNIFNNPKIQAEFSLPISVFQSFNFDKYIYIKTKDLTGYFIVTKIENYRNALTAVKTELLYADG